MRTISMAALLALGLGAVVGTPLAAQSCTGNPCSVSATYSANVGVVRVAVPAFLKLSVSNAATVKTNARWVLQVATTSARSTRGTPISDRLVTTQLIEGSPGLQRQALDEDQHQGTVPTAVVYTLAVR